MQTETQSEAIRNQVREWKKEGHEVAFVPTMGFLHEGHLSLMRHGKDLCTKVVVSIFVNPTQFGPGEDLDSYPRDTQGDIEKCRTAGVDLVFLPEVVALYPEGAETFVETTRLPQHLCGKKRPGHFRGVTTICTKLFNIVAPDKAIFGEKDFQQVQVIRKMVRDLCMDLEIVTVPTARAADGLALSSRNAYLTPEERLQAPILYRTLVRTRQRVADGETQVASLLKRARADVSAAGGTIDYISIVDNQTLEPAEQITPNSHMLLAVQFGKARLIDNTSLSVSGSQV